MSNARAALVTGGGVRVGKAIVMALARAGYDVAIHCHHSVEEAHTLVQIITEMGAQGAVFEADLTAPKAPEKLVSAAVEHWGRLDLLVNNAAVFYDDTATMMQLALMKRLNVDAPRACIEAALPALEQAQGSVLNIADIAWQKPLKGYKAYSRTKHSLVELTRTTAISQAARGVRINAVSPGLVMPAPQLSRQSLDAIIGLVPMGRMGDANDVANAVVYLADAPYVTGQIIAIDGGRSLVSEKDEDEPQGSVH